MSETQLVASIRERFALERGVILWRNNTGKLQDARGRWVTYGIGVGGADLVGIVTTPGAHNCPIGWGVFFALETKMPKGRITPEQVAWGRVVRDHGGFYCVVRSVEESVAALVRCRAGASE